MFLNTRSPLNLLDRYIRIKSIVERRSKGKLFQAVSVLDGKRVAQRIVDVVLANANHNDGLPTSILRELSLLRTLAKHKNVNQLIEA